MLGDSRWTTGQSFAPAPLALGREPGSFETHYSAPSAKRKVALGREVEFRFRQWRCAFVFHWMQKGELELQGRGENGMGDARRRKSSC